MKITIFVSELGRQVAKTRSRHWLQIQGSIDSLILPTSLYLSDYQRGLLSASESNPCKYMIINHLQNMGKKVKIKD